MQNFFTKTGTYIKTHKKTSIFIAIVILVIAYFIYKKETTVTGETTYTLGTVQTGTIVSSITGSGQMSAGRTLALTPQASGTITSVPVVSGQSVREGQVIATIDDTTAQEAVATAQANLQSAELSLEKEQEPTATATLLQAEGSLTQANTALSQSYQDGFNDISNTFLDLPSITTGLDQALYNDDVSTSTNGQQNVSYYQNQASQYETSATTGKAASLAAEAEAKYQAAEAAYTANFNDYKNTDRTADPATIQTLLNETYTTAVAVADAVQSENNLIQYYQDVVNAQNNTPAPKSTTYLNELSGYETKINADVSTLLNDKNTIANDTAAVPEDQANLDQLQAGTDPLTIQSAQLSVTNAQNSLQQAEDNLSDYTITAPFSGTLANVAVAVGDPASSGTTVATLITTDEVLILPLNEIDVSKVALGDKATITFDALPNLTLTGEVAQIDTVGTVSSGVVDYDVTLSLDTENPQVLPGMTATASIITQVDSDVLTVPASAVKTSGTNSYVLVLPNATGTSVTTTAAPQQVPVTTGLTDNVNTEIDSGLTNGETIVTKSTVVGATAAAKTTSAASATSLLGGGGATGSRGGGGGGRIAGGAL